MGNKWAYLGEVSPREFGEIAKAFPGIVGVGVDDEGDIILGCSTEIGDEAIGIYQLIISIWGNEEKRQKCWDAL